MLEENEHLLLADITPDMRQSKTLVAMDERGSKIARNSVFDWHLTPVGRQMPIMAKSLFQSNFI